MRPRLYSQLDLARFSLLYLPITVFWTATLTQWLPARIEILSGANKGLGMSFVGSLGAIAATLVMLAVGPLSDNTSHSKGRRYPWVVGGILLGALATFCFATATSLPSLLLAYVLVRVGLNGAIAAYEAIVPDRVQPEQHAQASAWSEFWDLGGQIGGAALTLLLSAGALNRRLSLSLPRNQESMVSELLMAAFCVCLLLIALALNLSWVRDEPLPAQKQRPWNEVVGSIFKFNTSQAPDFYRLYLSRCMLNIGLYTGVEFLRYYVEENLLAPKADLTWAVMVIILCVTAGGFVGALGGGWLGDRVSKRGFLYVACSITALSALAFNLTSDIFCAYFIAFFYGIGFSSINTIDWAFATNLVPRGQEARYLAIFQTCFTLPIIWAVGVGGIIGQHFGYRTLFWTIPVYILIGMALLARVRERHELPEFGAEAA